MGWDQWYYFSPSDCSVTTKLVKLKLITQVQFTTMYFYDRRHLVFGCVHPWVTSLCIPETPWREFHLILVADIFGFIDVLMMLGQGRSRWRHNRRRQPVEFQLVFVGILSVFFYLGIKSYFNTSLYAASYAVRKIDEGRTIYAYFPSQRDQLVDL